MSATYNCFSYDGTLEGLLCTIVKCINMKVMPHNIKSHYIVREYPDQNQYMHITSDYSLADKFYRYIGNMASIDVQQMISDCFLTSLPNKERDIFLLICKALKNGASVAEDYQDDVVKRIHTAVTDLYREVQSYFSEITYTPVNGVNISIINPRNYILPVLSSSLLKNHDICDFLIYDKRHRILLMRRGQSSQIIDTTTLINKSSLPSSDISTDTIYSLMWNYFSSNEHIIDMSSNRTYKSADALTRFWEIAS